MLNTKQVILISGVIILMVVLYMQPLKSLVKEGSDTEIEESNTSEAINLAGISEIAKQGLNSNLAKDITDLENSIVTASAEDKLSLLKELAEKWNDVNKAAPQAYTLQEIAEIEPTFKNWLNAGNAYTEAYSNIQDTVMVPVLTQRAVHAYEKALEIEEGNLEAKTGLGSAYVNGPNPMQGITMLLDVVKEDPKNTKANFSLGLFSMQSRQFDKAVDRFKTVIEKEPGAEAWFYLATSYENIGLKNEAIHAFEQSKRLAADPSLSQFIDRRINELSN